MQQPELRRECEDRGKDRQNGKRRPHKNRTPSTDREAKPHAQKGRQQNQVCEIRKDPDLTGNPSNEGELQSQNAESGEAKLEASGSAAESLLELSGFSLPEPAPRSFYNVLCFGPILPRLASLPTSNRACRRCSTTRRQNIHGDGPLRTRVFFLGDLPCASRDGRRKDLVGTQLRTGTPRHNRCLKGDDPLATSPLTLTVREADR